MFFQKPIPFLMYHCINSFPTVNAPEGSPGSLLNLPPEVFKKQMDWLEKEAFYFLSLDEAVALKGKIPLPRRAVAVTFDDGYLDNYEKAFPILIARKRPAALFVVINWVGQKGFMSWKEIRELSNHGITIGSHSLTHRWLKTITDERELEDEVVESKKRIEDKIGKEVRYFSYPAGIFDDRVVEKVKKAGYRAAWISGTRPNNPVRDPFYCLRRVKVSSSDAMLFRFAVKAYGLKGIFQP